MRTSRQRSHVTSVDGGSALVAILLVVVILAICVVIASRQLSSTHPAAKSRTSIDAVVLAACTSDLAAIKSSAEAVFIHEGAYPTDPMDLVASNGKGGLLREFPIDPHYRLTYPGSGGPPHVDVTGVGLHTLADQCESAG